MTTQWQRSTTPTPLDDARAAQQRYRDHVTKVCKVPAGVACYTCQDLDAKAAGFWVRANTRPHQGSARGLPSNE
jgi:hypothetical protein